MRLPEAKVILFTGNYGSGKTEVAVNYTLWLAREGHKVKIADLDLVNPYFRCREAREPLEALGVSVIAPTAGFHHSELPILLPEIRGLLEKPDDISILDVGGDDVGARVLAALSDLFGRVSYEMYFVANRNRPFTDTLEGCLRILSEIEQASRLKVSAIVGNTHLMDETTKPMIEEAIEFTAQLARMKGLPVAFVAVERTLLSSGHFDASPFPILPIDRYMLPPWKQRLSLGETSTHSRDGFGRLTSRTNQRQRN
ncbi:MAG: cobalamin biosynthesis protein CbiA [bacterium]